VVLTILIVLVPTGPTLVGLFDRCQRFPPPIDLEVPE